MMLRGMADRFDWQKPAQAYVALYQKLLSMGKPLGVPEARCTEPATTAPVFEITPEETAQISEAAPTAEVEPAGVEIAEAATAEEEPILEAATAEAETILEAATAAATEA